MNKTHTQILKQIADAKGTFFKDYRYYCNELKTAAEETLGEARVIVFGSVVRGQHGPGSDIDVLVISKNMPDSLEERRWVKAGLNSLFDMLCPLQIHLANPREYEEWYKKFIREEYQEI